MVQSSTKPLTPRQIEIITILTALGGKSNYENLYRAVRQSLMSRHLKLSGKGTFDKELDSLITLGFIEKENLGRRPIYKLSKKVSNLVLSKQWLEQHIKTLEFMMEKIRARSIEGYVEPRIERVFMIEKTVLDTKINDLFISALQGENLDQGLNELVNYVKERFKQLRMLNFEDKAKLYKVIVADTLRSFYMLEVLIREAYQSIK